MHCKTAQLKRVNRLELKRSHLLKRATIELFNNSLTTPHLFSKLCLLYLEYLKMKVLGRVLFK